ncbi:MAG: hypothetical protein ABEI06_07270 [Halobacteriaceae archaeon]
MGASELVLAGRYAITQRTVDIVSVAYEHRQVAAAAGGGLAKLVPDPPSSRRNTIVAMNMAQSSSSVYSSFDVRLKGTDNRNGVPE